NFGEGEYDQTEKLIRTLLGVEQGSMTQVANQTPTGLLTPESYIGYGRAERFVGDQARPGRAATYHFPATVPTNDLALDGVWTVLDERAISGPGAGLRLHFEASKVYLVLGGRGRVAVLVNGRQTRTLRVDGDRLYTLVNGKKSRNALLELRFTPGVSAYAF